MNRMMRVLTPLLALACTATLANAQFYKIHNADTTISAIGEYTTPLTTSNAAITQTNSDRLGALISFRDHPVAWAGIEVNAAYVDYSERYFTSTYYSNIKTDTYELTAAYMFHPHVKHLQPFLNVGGGAIDFEPSVVGPNQWRSTGLVELGFDIPTSNPHFGFRAQGRTLIYRAPNFRSPLLASKTWESTEEPSLGAWMRF